MVKLASLNGECTMKYSEKSCKRLKQEFLYELDYLSNIGNKMFIYPFIGRSKLSTYCYYFTYGLIFLTSTQLCVTLCLTGFKDWFEIINIAPNLGVSLMILIKYGKMHRNRYLYDEILNHFRNDLWEAISDSVSHKKILNEYTKITRLIIRFEFYYTICLAVVVNIFPRIIMYYDKEDTYIYPFDGWYPFDKKQWYYVAYIWESFMTTLVIFIFVFANMIHISFTRYICMELKILGNSTKCIFITDEDVANIGIENAERTHANIRGKLKFIIVRHQYLSKITSDLDQVLGDTMRLTYAFGSGFICLTIFTATVIDNLYMSLRYFSFFCSLLVEVFVQCIMGQLLIDHSEKLERAIYFADWPHADPGTKRMLLIFLTRAQKPFKFTARGYLTMNLDTFSGICSLSYQFFNLLHTAYSE